MVPGHRAAAVDGLALAVAQHVHQPVVGQGLQDPVGRGQGDRDAFVLQDPVQLLGADEVIQFVQGGADGQPLLGDALLFAASWSGPGGRQLALPSALVPCGMEWTRFPKGYWQCIKITSRSAGGH